MPGDADIARIAALLADETRAAMLLMLLNGNPQSSSALARGAGVSASLASTHLRKLLDGELVVVEKNGRQRLYRLPNPVADALEGLLLLAPPSTANSLRQANHGLRIRRARICYDHLAGAPGVAITEALLRRELLIEHNQGYQLTVTGIDELATLGIAPGNLTSRGRPLTRRCMDWSERRNHLAGRLGATLTRRFIDMSWILTHESTRAVTITTTGRRELNHWLGPTIL